MHTSGAHISYECGLGRRFVDAGIHQEFLNFTCETRQDGTAVWRPFPKLQPCQWVACIDAPAAPNGTNLADLRVNVNETYDYAITGKDIKSVCSFLQKRLASLDSILGKNIINLSYSYIFLP